MKVTLKDIKDAPNLKDVKDMFKVSEKDTIISYGDTIYSPGAKLSADLIAHELVHCERQGFSYDTARLWWDKYMNDPEFRLAEELMAYKEQYRYCEKVFSDRNKLAKIAFVMAQELSSERYGKIITHSDAFALIRRYGIIAV